MLRPTDRQVAVEQPLCRERDGLRARDAVSHDIGRQQRDAQQLRRSLAAFALRIGERGHRMMRCCKQRPMQLNGFGDRRIAMAFS